MTKFAEYDSAGPRGTRLTDADGLVIRACGPPDLAAAAEITAEREERPLDACRAELERMLEEMRAGRAQLFVADLAGRVVGFGKVAQFAPPAGSPANTSPEGWYLAGLIVRPEHRRRGVGYALTVARLAWIAERSRKAYYFANESNRVSVDLHAATGFVERSRDFHHPGVRFTGGGGILFECDLDRWKGGVHE